MPGPDLPDPHELFSVEHWSHRWPSSIRKAELIFGVLVFSGDFDQRDVETAQHAYPGRQVILNEGGGLEIHPARDDPPQSVYECDYRELITQAEARRDQS